MKDLKISKELLGEVLGYEVDAFLGISENEIDYTCCRDKDIGYEDISINIYEFVFMCKEWVNKQEYWANSGYDNKYYCMLRDMPDNKWFYADTEVEAIFKACEWVLSEINK